MAMARARVSLSAFSWAAAVADAAVGLTPAGAAAVVPRRAEAGPEGATRRRGAERGTWADPRGFAARAFATDAPEPETKPWHPHYPRVYDNASLACMKRFRRPPASAMQRAKHRKALILSGRGEELLPDGAMAWLHNHNKVSPRFRPEGRPAKGTKAERTQLERWKVVRDALDKMPAKIAAYREKRQAWKKKVTPLDAVLYDHSPKKLRRLYKEKGHQ